jgi:hypothetical protein
MTQDFSAYVVPNDCMNLTIFVQIFETFVQKIIVFVQKHQRSLWKIFQKA